MLKYTRSSEDSRGLHIVFGEPITPANFLAACNAAIDLAKIECSTQTAVAIVFEAKGVEVQVTETDSAEVQLALWERKLSNCNELPAESQDNADGPKNALGHVAAKPFYIWANEDCANKTDDFKEAKVIRLALFNEGGESVHIVDADGVEVVDEEIKAHEEIATAGYFAGARNPDVKPGFPGAFMVNDPQDSDGFAIVGDDIGALILEARDHLIEPDQERSPRSGVVPQKETPLLSISARIAEALPAATGYEKGYRDALESMALALAPKLASTLDDAITTALDAYANNTEETDAVTLNLNVFDDVGNLVDGTTATLSVGQLSDIVDHASQLILIRRDGQSLDNVLDELDEALSVADVIEGVENHHAQQRTVG